MEASLLGRLDGCTYVPINMNNANYLNFYNLLFSTEIAVFGIISAVILVFVQLIYSNYSYRQIWHVIKNKYLVLFFGFSIIDLLMTAAGIFLLVVGGSSAFRVFHFSPESVITHPIYAFVCLALIFVSISFFVILIVKNITYLQPHRAIFLVAKGIQYDAIRDFIWKKYEPKPPFKLQFSSLDYIFDDIDDNESKEERDVRLRSELEAENNDLDAIEGEIKAIKQKVADAEDPLLPVRDMMILFIKRSDLSSLNESSSLLSSTSIDFITKIPRSKDDKWLPDDSLPMGFTHHLIETLQALLEIAEKEGVESAKQEILKVSLSYATSLFSLGYYQELQEVESFWQSVADTSIGKSSKIFKNIVEYYWMLGVEVFDSLEENPTIEKQGGRKDVLDSIFRNVGWLGERMLVKLPLEDSPLMSNYEYSTEYDALLNCLLGFSDIYNRSHPNLYPLIYFDALYVVFRKLVHIYKQQEVRKLDDNIFDIAYAFSSFAEKAIKAKNASGAGLSVVRIWELYVELKRARLDKHAHDAIELLVGIGFLAAAYQNKLERVDFMSKQIHEWIIDKLVSSGESVENAVMNSYIHSAIEISDGHDDAWGFITHLGKRMGTNFGFAFDPGTGEMYPDGDPRRR